MQQTPKERLIYGVVFLLFVILSFVFIGNSGADDLTGSLQIENEENLNFDERQADLRRMLSKNGFSNLECARGVWPTVKCEFDLVTSEVSEPEEITELVTEMVQDIAFEDLDSNKSLSCFDLNDLNVYSNEDMHYGKVRATCILNLREFEN